MNDEEKRREAGCIQVRDQDFSVNQIERKNREETIMAYNRGERPDSL